MNLKVDKNLAASIALHLSVIVWGLVSFSARSLEAPPPESMPVDIISADQLSKLTAGSKTGEKDKPKPLVEKVADAKPVDDTVGKITEKPPVETAVAPTPPPKPVEKPVEKKPIRRSRLPRTNRRMSRSRSRRNPIRPRSIRSPKP